MNFVAGSSPVVIWRQSILRLPIRTISEFAEFREILGRRWPRCQGSGCATGPSHGGRGIDMAGPSEKRPPACGPGHAARRRRPGLGQALAPPRSRCQLRVTESVSGGHGVPRDSVRVIILAMGREAQSAQPGSLPTLRLPLPLAPVPARAAPTPSQR